MRRILGFKDGIPNFIRASKYATILAIFAQSGTADTYPFKRRAKRNEGAMMVMAFLLAAKDEVEEEIEKEKRPLSIDVAEKLRKEFSRLKRMIGVKTEEELYDIASEAIAVLRLIHKVMNDEELRKKLLIEEPLLDAFGGHGTFARAALTIGIPAVYVELNPIAYFFFTTTIKGFPEGLEKKVEELLDYLEEECSRYYPKDVYLTHRARLVRCEHCGEIIPVVSAKSRNSSRYRGISRINKRYRVIPKKEDEYRFKRTFEIEGAKADDLPKEFKCPECGGVIKFSKNKSRKKLYKDLLEIDPEVEGFKLSELPRAFAAPLAEATYDGELRELRKSLDMIYDAYVELLEGREEYKKYLPYERIPERSIDSTNHGITEILSAGIKYRTQLMTPRQLLCYAKIVRRIRDLEEGDVKDRIAMIITKTLQHNVLTRTTESKRAKHISSNQSFYIPETPVELSIPGSRGKKKGEGTISSILSDVSKYSIVVHGKKYFKDSPIVLKTGFPVLEEVRVPSYRDGKPEVLALNEAVQRLDDYDELIESVSGAFIDPPYLNMIPYRDLSRLYYVRLKRMYDKLPFDKTLEEIYELDLTDDSIDKFAEKLRESFRAISNVLKPDGVAILQFAPPSSMKYEDFFKLRASIMAAAIENDLYPVLATSVLSEKSKGKVGTGEGISRTMFILLLKPEAFEEFLNRLDLRLEPIVGMNKEGIKERIKSILESGRVDKLFEGVISYGLTPRPEESIAIGASISAAILAKLSPGLDFEDYREMLEDIIPTAAGIALDKIVHKDFRILSVRDLLKSGDMTVIYAMALKYGLIDPKLISMTVKDKEVRKRIDAAKNSNKKQLLVKGGKSRASYLYKPRPLQDLIKDYSRIRSLAGILATALQIYDKEKEGDSADIIEISKLRGTTALAIARMLIEGLDSYIERLTAEYYEEKNKKEKFDEISAEVEIARGLKRILEKLTS